MAKPTHVGPEGDVEMVDVSAKPATLRIARAEAFVRMSDEAAFALREATLPKGDAMVAAQIAGILAAKQTPALIPLAHSLPLAKVDVAFEWAGDGRLRVETRVQTVAQTGVEMEAMVASAIAALTIYDMCKAVDRDVTVEMVRLIEKSGGKSGHWSRV